MPALPSNQKQGQTMKRTIHDINSRKTIYIAVITALSSVLFSGYSWAQSNDEASAGVLEEVVVTATRREESIQDVALSITTFSGEQVDLITSGTGADIRFLRGKVPSLNIESSFGRAFPRFYIRGWGNTDFDINASQPVSLLYDEVVQENPMLKGFPIFDIQRIEVLRGPQGTLFGRNTPAGIVKVDSVKPSQESSGYATISYGTDANMTLETAFGGGLSDNWSARFSGIYMSRDDWVDNGYTGEKDALGGFDEWALRGQLLYDAGNDFTALISAHYRDLDGTARLFRANIIKSGSNDLDKDNYKRDRVWLDGSNQQDVTTWGAMMRLEWDFGNSTLTSVTGYETIDAFSRGDIDGGYGGLFEVDYFGPGLVPFSSESADGVPDHSQFTQELRWASDDWGKADWQAGIFYFDEDLTIDTFNYNTNFGGGVNGYVLQKQKTRAWGVFTALDYELGDTTVLNAGIRYSDDDKDFSAQRFLSPLAWQGVPDNLGPIYANADDSSVSWDLSLTWTASDDVNVYGRVASGFRAPSIQGRLLFGDTVSVADSETSLSWEGGVKSTFAGGRARANFSLFYYTVDDAQLTAVGGEANFNQVINANKVTGKGFELDLQALLTDNFMVTAGVSYNDTEIKDDGLAIAPCGAPLTPCTVNDPPGTVEGSVLIDGNVLPQAPKWLVNLTGRWSMPTDNGEFYIFGDLSHRSKVNFFLYEATEFTGKSLAEFGMRAGYIWGSNEVSLFGRNIFDQEVIVGGIDFNNLTGFVNEPARWGLQYRYTFQ
jgi:iron complex outermembrane receptor protein